MKNMKKINACVLTALFILCYFFRPTVFAKEIVEYDDNNNCITDEVMTYEVLAEKYLSTELTDEELVQQYEGAVSVEYIPVTNEMFSAVTCLVDGDIDNDAEYSVSLERLTIENNDEYCLYVLSAEGKTSTGSKEQDGVTLYGTIYWIDNLGTNNVLLKVTGGRYGSYTGNGTYSYGGKYQILKMGTFSASGFNDQDYWGTENISFHLNVSTNITSGSTVSLAVDTSIFD
jgi:hypothetical protein